MKKALFTIFALLFLIIAQVSIPKSNLLAQQIQKYILFGPDAYGNSSCLPSDKGTLTYNECQAKLQEGRYRLDPGSPGSAPVACVKDPNGPFATLADCEAKRTEGKYVLFGPDSLGQSNCIKNNNGTMTYDECQAKLHEGRYVVTIDSFGNSTCVKNDNGPFTWDRCQAEIKNNPNPSTAQLGKNPCATPIPDPNDPGKFTLKLECQTAFGPIATNPADFISKILTVAIGLAGGIALIFMVIGSIKVLTSSGDQQKLTGGKDMIVAAVSGLLFLIFSVLILRFIGTSLLGAAF